MRARKLRPWSRRLSLYRGAFLEDLSLPDSALFEEWRILKREQLQRQVLDLLSRLVAGYERQAEYQRALAHAWRKVDLEPWDETAHRQVMRLLARSGRSAEALAQYEACRTVLAEELGVEPAARDDPAVRADPAWRAGAGDRRAAPARRSQSGTCRRLPRPFSGARTSWRPWRRGWQTRTRGWSPSPGQEVAARRAWPWKRVHALPNGIARRWPTGRPSRFPHGVVFVPLAAIDSVEGLVPALADALELRLQGGQEQLIEALRRKQILLILDNLEHLLAGVGFLAEILRAAPGVQILATSRERLQLQAERVLPLGGLAYPDHDSQAVLARGSRPGCLRGAPIRPFNCW